MIEQNIIQEFRLENIDERRNNFVEVLSIKTFLQL